jgi:glycosyltransferase involved in cell wall biosynthesis
MMLIHQTRDESEAVNRIPQSPPPLAAICPVSGNLDSVYFFMWSGWRTELESNRWHWGKRWARRLPTVFIQPELFPHEAARSEPEPRLAGVELLAIEMAPRNARDWFMVALRQAGQIAAHMASRGHRRPLFWFYNPQLAVPFALVPASARVFHATENYFDFGSLSEEWLNCCRFAIESCDLVVCCSSGVAAGLSRNTQCNEFLTLPNGCDFSKYSQPAPARGEWAARLADWHEADRRIAVFAGNINHRVDFDLIEALVARCPELGFALVGPVDFSNLSAAQQSGWRRLQRAGNVRALGRVPADDLPALYRRCDVGIIPYRTDLPMVVENGFPLKVLEMAAAGLPVVASFMKPLQEITDAVTIALDPGAFYGAVSTHSRRTLSVQQREAAERICRAHDYDLLFDRMMMALSSRIGDSPCKPASLATLVQRTGLSNYLDGLTGFAASPSAIVQSSRIPLRYHVGTLLGLIPPEVRQIVPEPIKRFGRRYLG